MVGLYLGTQLTQTIFVQFGEGKAAISGKAATADTLGQEYMV